MNKTLQRISAIVRKEVIHLRRDWHTLFMMLAIPVIELFLLSYSATFTAQHLPLAVYDQSHDEQSRAFVNSLVNSHYFDVTLAANSEAEILRALDEGKVKAGLVIPVNFTDKISRQEASALLLLDGSDSYSLQSAYGAASSIAQKFSLDLTLETIQSSGLVVGEGSLPITTSVQTLYNPTRADLYFIIPALAAMLLQMFAIMGMAMTIVREREWGVTEQLLSTPTRPLENILGKMIPYFILTLFEAVVIHSIGSLWFGVPFRGSVLLYLTLASLFVLSSLSVGLLVSTVTTSQKQVQTIGSLTLLLSFLLSGLVFSRVPMPLWTQFIGALLPVTHFIPIVRGIMIKGVGLSALWSNVGALFTFIVILFTVLPLITRKRMD
jgi:ABC-2 type transport system permease protein